MTRLVPMQAAISLAALSLTLSCSTAISPGGAKSATDERLVYGQLELLNVTTTPGPTSVTFHGVFRNEFDDPIDGIRIVLRIRQDSSPTSPEIARTQKTIEAHLEPAEHIAFDIIAKVPPSSLANVGLLIDGFAVRRAGEVLPISPVWQE